MEMTAQQQQQLVQELVAVLKPVASGWGRKTACRLVAERLTPLIRAGELSKEDGLRLAVEVDRALSPKEGTYVDVWAEHELRKAVHTKGPRAFVEAIEVMEGKKYYHIERDRWPKYVAIWMKNHRVAGENFAEFLEVFHDLMGSPRTPLVTMNQVLALLQSRAV